MAHFIHLRKFLLLLVKKRKLLTCYFSYSPASGHHTFSHNLITDMSIFIDQLEEFRHGFVNIPKYGLHWLNRDIIISGSWWAISIYWVEYWLIQFFFFKRTRVSTGQRSWEKLQGPSKFWISWSISYPIHYSHHQKFLQNVKIPWHSHESSLNKIISRTSTASKQSASIGDIHAIFTRFSLIFWNFQVSMHPFVRNSQNL